VTTPFENVDPEVRTMLEEVSGFRRREQTRRPLSGKESFAADVSRFVEDLPKKRREYAGVLLLRAFYGLRSLDPRYQPLAVLDSDPAQVASPALDSVRRSVAAGAVPTDDPDPIVAEGGDILQRACGLTPGSELDSREYLAIARAAHALAPCAESACYMGHIEGQLGNVRSAIEFYEQAIACSTSNLVRRYALSSLAAIQIYGGDPEAALHSIRRATEVDEPLQYSLILRLFLALMSGDETEIVQADRLIARAPGAESWPLDRFRASFQRLLPAPPSPVECPLGRQDMHITTVRLVEAIGGFGSSPWGDVIPPPPRATTLAAAP